LEGPQWADIGYGQGTNADAAWARLERKRMEKRRFKRVLFRTEAMVQYGDKTFTGEVADLSLRGMFVKSPHEIPLGETVKAKIFLSGSTSELSIQVDGTIVRHQGENGFGIQFHEMDVDSFVHLRNIVIYNSGDAAQVMEEFMDFMKPTRQSDPG
jgi:hypothetical protein